MGLSLAVDDDDPDKADSIMDAFKKIKQTSLGKKAGWVRFAEGLGVDPKAITAPFLDHLQFVEKFLDAAYEATLCNLLSEVPGPRTLRLTRPGLAKITAAQVAALEDAWTAKVG